MNVSFWLDNKEFRLNLIPEKQNDIQVSLGKNTYRVSVEFLNTDEILLNIDGKIYDVIINSNTTSYTVYVNGQCFQIEKKSALQILGPKTGKQPKANVNTSMPGRIVKILMKEDDEVAEGQAVLILEAMKMQNEIKSPQSGRISKIYPKAGDSVETGALLFTVD
jgi:biotin carboxyl carrier protein